MITKDRIIQASNTINPIFRNTPQYKSIKLSKLLGCSDFKN